MADPVRLPDEAEVVRCGTPPFLKNPLRAACRQHPDGPYGFSVQASADRGWAGLAANCRNNQVGVTTVGAIREAGYDVVPTRGEGFHATVVVPRDWTDEAGAELARLFRPQRNPSPRR